MPDVALAQCPQCGASLRPEPNADSATCSFCGATSLIKRPAAPALGAAPPAWQQQPWPGPPQQPQQQVVVVRGSSGGSGCVVLLAVLGVVGVAGVAGALMFVRGASSTGASQPAEQKASPLAEVPKVATPAAPERSFDVDSRRRPLLEDVNGDGAPDVVVQISGPHPKKARYAAFDGKTGKEIWQTSEIDGPDHQVTASVLGGRLLVAHESGKLIGYDLKKPDPPWSIKFPDKVVSMCATGKGDEVLVVLANEHRIAVHAKTGGKSSTKGDSPCAPMPSDSSTRRLDPRDRSDPRAPAGVEAVYCGGVRVTGDQNYTVPDACGPLARVSSEDIEGMSPGALWREGKDGFLVLGYRTPGTRVPMVGLLRGKKLAWKAEVPPSNPLEASAGAPDQVATAGGKLFVGYRMNGKNGSFLTAFNVADGARAWNVALPEKLSSVDHVAATADTVFVYGGSSVVALKPADGATKFIVGPDK